MSDEPDFGPERYSTVEGHELLGFDAGYAQAIKDVVKDLRLNAGMCITAEAQYFNRVLAVRIESRFSAPSPGPEGDVEKRIAEHVAEAYSHATDPYDLAAEILAIIGHPPEALSPEEAKAVLAALPDPPRPGYCFCGRLLGSYAYSARPCGPARPDRLDSIRVKLRAIAAGEET